MGNYSDNDGSVRIDFFRPSGKWITTEAVDMQGFYFGSATSAGPGKTPKHYLLPAAVIEAIRADPDMHLADGTLRHAGSWAVCLDPYHEFSHPQMFLVPER